MNEAEAEVIRVAYARLAAIKENVPAGTYGQVPEQHVSEYHAVLDQLARIGVDIDQFRVPAEWVKKRWRGRRGTGEDVYSDTRYVDRSLLLTKVDSLLNYFRLVSSEPRAKIGFSGPRK